jgi:hypothetical protein
MQVIEKVAHWEPSGFDSADGLDAFLDGVRWVYVNALRKRGTRSGPKNGRRNGSWKG